MNLCNNRPMLNQTQIHNFATHGFCRADGLLSAADFVAVTDECNALLDELCAQFRAAGKLKDDYAGEPFLTRYLNISRDTGGLFAQHFTIALPQKEIHADTPILLSPGVFDLLVHPAILDAVESLIGGEIAASPVSNIRIKPPESAHMQAQSGGDRAGLFRTTPWHQDNGVITADGDASDMITVWFSLTDVPPEAGCLQVIPGSHRVGNDGYGDAAGGDGDGNPYRDLGDGNGNTGDGYGNPDGSAVDGDGNNGNTLRPHCPDHNGELSIPRRELPRAEPLPLPVRAGDVLFLHRRLCHASLPNVSDQIRWSFDLRYLPVGKPGGRDLFPTFTARSRRRPDSVLTDAQQWAQLWLTARANLAGKPLPQGTFNRWRTDAAACA